MFMTDTKRCGEQSCTKLIPKGLNKYCSYGCSDKSARRRKKLKKAESWQSYRDKADKKASLYYRSKTPYCEAQPNYQHECKNGLQWCHVYRRDYKGIRYAEYNHLIMCGSAHTYFTHNPEEWYIFMQTNYPDRWEQATKNRHSPIGDPLEYFKTWNDYFSSV